jgi:hypothetical protein
LIIHRLFLLPKVFGKSLGDVKISLRCYYINPIDNGFIFSLVPKVILDYGNSINAYYQSLEKPKPSRETILEYFSYLQEIGLVFFAPIFSP